MKVQSGKGMSPTNAVPENDIGKGGMVPRDNGVGVGEDCGSGGGGVGVDVGATHVSACAWAMEEGADNGK